MIIYIIISFLLEGLISNYLSSSLLRGVFTLISLSLIYPYYYKDLNKYYILSFIIGFIYDITYTNTLFLNACVFLAIAFLIIKIDKIISNNLINSILIGCITIFLYRIIIYLIYIIIGKFNFNINILLSSITSSLILNIIYIILSYVILNLISKKLNIKKM